MVSNDAHPDYAATARISLVLEHQFVVHTIIRALRWWKRRCGHLTVRLIDLDCHAVASSHSTPIGPTLYMLKLPLLTSKERFNDMFASTNSTL